MQISPVIPAGAPRGPFMVSSNVNPVDKHTSNQNELFIDARIIIITLQKKNNNFGIMIAGRAA